MEYFKATDEFGGGQEDPVFLRSSDGIRTDVLTLSGKWKPSLPLAIHVYLYTDTETPGVSWTEITAEDLPDGVEP